MDYVKCRKCDSSLIWKGDHDTEEGVVSSFNCKCGVYVEKFTPFDEGGTKWIKYYLETASR